MKKVVCFLIISVFSPLSLSDTNNYSLLQQFVQAAKNRTQHSVRYDGSYISIPYPNGDVPASLGVCTDVVIRSYRKVGIDLQTESTRRYACSF